MTVKELISELKKFDEEIEVVEREQDIKAYIQKLFCLSKIL